MKTRPAFLTALLAGIVWLPLGGSAQTLSRQPVGEAFSGAVSFTEGEGRDVYKRQLLRCGSTRTRRPWPA